MGRPASSSQKIVWRYSSSAAVAASCDMPASYRRAAAALSPSLA
jgi:hypothetical protein